MPQPVDLLMPKLGLTMEEGRVARWEVAPGTHFAAGDIIVVVETDKIASDVEAPAAGMLTEIFAPEGTTLPVSAPIARWLPDHASRPVRGPESPPKVATGAPDVAPPAVIALSAPTPSADTSRIIASPYARRLARDAGMALTGISGSGPNGRIKAADVEAALTSARALRSLPISVTPAAISISRLSIAEVRVATDALCALDRSFLDRGGNSPQRSDFILLACARALVSLGVASTSIAGELHGQDGTSYVPPFDAIIVRRLSDVSDLRRRATVEAPPAQAVALLVACAPPPLERFAPAAIAGTTATLGVGAEHDPIGFGADRTLVERRQQLFSLSYDAAVWSNAQAISFLTAVKQFLEEPLHLLAS